MFGFLSCASLATTAHIREAEAANTVRTKLDSFLRLIVSLFPLRFGFYFRSFPSSNRDRTLHGLARLTIGLWAYYFGAICRRDDQATTAAVVTSRFDFTN
jgi:hypothetical protein